MKIAIPLYHEDVAPRFEFADQFMIVEVQNAEVLERRNIPLQCGGIPDRLEEISHRGVRALLCSGFNRNFIPFAHKLQMSVFVGLTGTVDDILCSYLRGELSAWPSSGAPAVARR